MTYSTQGPGAAASNSRNTTDKSTPPLCAGDPQSIIWRFFAKTGAQMRARDTLFLWVMALPHEAVAQDAAQNVLQTYGSWLDGDVTDIQQEMLDLLEQVTKSPQTRPRKRSTASRQQATYH